MFTVFVSVSFLIVCFAFLLGHWYHLEVYDDILHNRFIFLSFFNGCVFIRVCMNVKARNQIKKRKEQYIHIYARFSLTNFT